MAESNGHPQFQHANATVFGNLLGSGGRCRGDI